MECRVLFIGDIVGKPGRQVIAKHLPLLRTELNLDCVIGNAENAAGGKGIEPGSMKDLLESGIDVLTSGNHIWDKNEVLQCFHSGAPLLRPANYPHIDAAPLPGKDFWVWESKRGFSIAVINLLGRIFMDPVDCPFQCISKHLPEMKKQTNIVFVDMHAEATSEKSAMGWFLDGKVAAVFGSHSHVPTADSRLLPKGTAFQTDAGMTGPYDSIIGMKHELILDKFLTKRPKHFEVAKDNVWLSAICVTIDTETGLAKELFPVRKQL